MISRRHMLPMFAALPLVAAGHASAQGYGQTYALRTDAGDVIPNFRIPSTLDPALLRGIIHVGSASPDVTIYEFFDYQCPYCRSSASDLDALLQSESSVRLALVNNPILTLGSMQAAKVQQATLKLHGDAKAYELHRRLLAEKGQITGIRALDIAKELGLDPDALSPEADSPKIADVMISQIKLAANLGLVATPSFVIDGVGMLGWPGSKTIRSIVASVKTCDRPVCSPAKPRAQTKKI